MELQEYEHRYSTAAVSRDDAGVLTIQMGWRGRSLLWGGPPHQELPELFNAIASDRENRVVILTGTGDTFIGLGDGPNPLAEGRANATVWDRIIWEGNRLVEQMLAIEVPMIAAVNGPVSVHSELAVLCDVVLAAEHAYFQDAPHFQGGLVPGDSMQVVWPLLLGPNRGRYFLLTGQQIDAAEALQLGIVGEVLSADRVLTRAQEIAADLARLNPILLRNTRHALVRPLRRAIADDLHTGLALEAIASMSAREWNRRGVLRVVAERVPITIVPANEASWEDIEAVVGKARCWDTLCFCQRFKLHYRDWKATTADERAQMLREQTDCGYPASDTTSGLVAYVDGEPAGWCCVEPRPAFPFVTEARGWFKKRSQDRDDERIWAIACFVTRTPSRHTGVSRALAAAAVELARQRGAGAVEGYAMRTQPGVDITWGELHVGSRSIFADAGMREVAAPTKRRVVMRIDFLIEPVTDGLRRAA